MTSFARFLYTILFVFSAKVLAKDEGEFCHLRRPRQIGICVVFEKCQYAIEVVENGHRPKGCGFKGQIPIVCCPFDAIITTETPLTTTTSVRSTTTTVRPTTTTVRPTTTTVRPTTTIATTVKSTTRKNPTTTTTSKSTTAIVPEKYSLAGEKTRKKCFEYHPSKNGYNRFVYGGKKSLAQEFPHMAVLGFGAEDSKTWACGGSLISEDFILTAAHCVRNSELGEVKWVRLGDLDLHSESDDAKPQDFSVSTIFLNPQYKFPAHYHDIALLKLDKSAKFDEFVKPACLDTGNTVDSEEKLLVSGWGKVDFAGDASSFLLKADVKEIPNKECKKHYENVSERKLKNGVVEELQICAGQEDGRDTCPGDSGGPLQYKTIIGHPQQTLYVVGVTSFGKACGGKNSAGVYVRVAHYLDWIESIVWPHV